MPSLFSPHSALPRRVFACLAVTLLLCSCVATREGGRRFDPLKAAVNADHQIDDWLEGMGYPTQHRVPR